MASLSLLPYSNWDTMTQLGSAKLPILITCAKDINSDRKTFMNFNS